jgi:ABC-type transporter Mla subunit MlaD
MTSQATDTPEAISQVTDTTGAVIPYAPKAKNTDEADLLDRAGNAVLGLVNRAARTAEADLQAAREVAEKLADQLRAAQSRINELEANVSYYQDRTERAEKWLHQISSEIEQRFLGTDDSDGARRMAERLQNQDKIGAMPRPARRQPATPSFLQRLAKR